MVICVYLDKHNVKNNIKLNRSIFSNVISYKSVWQRFNIYRKTLANKTIKNKTHYISVVMNKKLLLLFSIAFAALIGKATHITHGNVYYEYLGKDANNDNRYKISIVLYRDCQTSTIPFDEEIDFGIYRNVSNRPLFAAPKAFLKDTTAINPLLISNNHGSFCFRSGKYEVIVSLPPDAAGYHVVWHRCCRRTINNIIDDNSTAYYAFIPGLENNSPQPVFDGPISFSPGNWYHLSYANTDKDGDTLTYILTDPLNGEANAANPMPVPPQTLSLPIPTVTYRNGFSAQNPMGNTGNFIVYAKNGNIRLYSGIQGIFIIGIKISEWRNGVLLAEHYREMPLYCVNTVPGDAVKLTAKPGTGIEFLLTWGYGINNAVNQLVLRRRTQHDTAWQNVAVFDSTGFNYSDTAVERDSLYWYQVIANTDFTSVPSNIVKISLNGVWPTGIYTPETNKLTAYPNPVSDRLFINDEKSSISAITITDISGRTLYETADMEAVKAKGLYTGFLPAGIYVLRAATPGGVQALRIVKD